LAISGTVKGMATPLGGLRLEREFERLYRRHRREVYRAVLRDVRDVDEAEDVTQIAFLDAYRALQRGDEPLRPRAWLLTIAQNAARRRYRIRAAGPREVELQAELLVAPDESGPSAVEIRQAFARLTPGQRKALVLREIAGRSYAEIALALDLTVPAVETLLFRARRALRLELAGWEPPARQRRRLGGLLLWPPAPLGDAAGSLAGWAAKHGAAAKLAGALSAAVVGTGLAVHSGGPAPAEQARTPQDPSRPAPALAVARPAAPAPAPERGRAAPRPRAKAAEKTPAPALPTGPAQVQVQVAPLVELPPLPAAPVTLPEVTLPVVEELVPAPLPELPVPPVKLEP
jgi:RNA polymerase sigma factor (sigma-70 family)